MSLSLDVEATFGDAGATFTVAADLDVPEGETLVLLGPSGSGKTLLLELVAGFHAHEGTVRVGGVDVTDDPPEERGVGVVFQEYALFPHLTARENVAFGARYHDDPRDPDDLLDALGVADLGSRTPKTLSGGEKQRVALARALAVRPRVFLLDEPLSALDAPTRDALRGDLLDVLADETAVYVTHDRTTARALADRVAVIDGGRVRQVGTPADVFARPASPFVARFTGANCLRRDALPPAVTADVAEGAHVAVRPERVELATADPDFDARVVRAVREDATYRVTLALDGERLDAFAATPPADDRVGVRLPREHCHVLDGRGTDGASGDGREPEDPGGGTPTSRS